MATNEQKRKNSLYSHNCLISGNDKWKDQISRYVCFPSKIFPIASTHWKQLKHVMKTLKGGILLVAFLTRSANGWAGCNCGSIVTNNWRYGSRFGACLCCVPPSEPNTDVERLGWYPSRTGGEFNFISPLTWK